MTRLSPSSTHDQTTLVRRTSADDRRTREQALARGEAMHRLLQSLPDIARDARAEAARRHLARTGRNFTPEECADIFEQVRRVLDDSRFGELFTPGSRAEVPIVGRLTQQDRTIMVAGQVDRLAVTADAILIADYKTNRPAPRATARDPAYVAQLALYRAVLGQIYPEKTVRAALIWTERPDLMEVPAAALDQALAALTSA